jgi:ABC-type phosphate transport system auxiliary subunit
VIGSWIWVLIPIAAIFAGVVKHWLSLQEKHIQVATHESAEKAARYAAQTERLEQRVRVLERIITDKGLELTDEIERLRDKPLDS